MTGIDVAKLVTHDGCQFVLGIAFLEQLVVDVNVIAAGGERVERLAVDQVELDVVGPHPVVVGFEMRVRAVVLLVNFPGRRDDVLADRLEVAVQIRVLLDGGGEALVGLVGLGFHGGIAHRTSAKTGGGGGGQQGDDDTGDEGRLVHRRLLWKESYTRKSCGATRIFAGTRTQASDGGGLCGWHAVGLRKHSQVDRTTLRSRMAATPPTAAGLLP